MKYMNAQILEAQWSPNRINSNRFTLRHIVIKLSKAKDKENLQKNKGEVIHHVQGILNKINNQFYKETMDARNMINLNCWKKKKSYLTKSFKDEGEIKTFPDKSKLREVAINRTRLYNMLKDVLQVEMKRWWTKMSKSCKEINISVKVIT